MSQRLPRSARRRPGARAWLALLSATAVLAGAPVAMAQGDGTARPVALQGRTVSFTDEGVRIDRRTLISASANPATIVGAPITISGVVKVRAGRAAAPRPVRLQELSGSGVWRTLTSKMSTRTGSFRFTVPASTTPRLRSFRVAARRVGDLAAARTNVLRVRVVEETVPTPPPTGPVTPPPTETPTGDWDAAEYAAPTDPAPVGVSSDWTWLWNPGGGRWNPCKVITWAYNPTDSYDGSLTDMTRAFARIAGRTGLHFKYVGVTDHEYTDDTFPETADIFVDWSDETHVPALAGGVVGLGGGSAYGVPAGRDVSYRIDLGYIVLDSGDSLEHGFARSGNGTWGQVMTHEALHVLGLGHANAKEEVMAPYVGSTNHLFGIGDLTGMSKIGASNGCL